MSHILVALTTREQRLFLGGGNETGLPSDSAKWVRPGDAQMADGAWEEEVLDEIVRVLPKSWGGSCVNC